MPKLSTEIVYNGNDNTIDFLLLEDGEAVDLAAVTKINLVVDSTQTVVCGNVVDSALMFITNETPSGTINGVNLVFTLANSPKGNEIPV